MKALRFENGNLKLVNTAILPHSSEALVRVKMAGICKTDLEIIRGYAGFSGTIGHEFVGIVEDSPEPSQIGRRVVGEINIGCGQCRLCQQKDPRHCLNRTVLGIHNHDGAFAEYLSLPPGNLFMVPPTIDDRQAVFTEPLAAGCEILDQIVINPSDRVAVIGDGRLGQLIARVIATTGCEPLLIGKHPEKLKLADQAGIRVVSLEHLQIDPPSRFDFVVEASGSPSGLRLALTLVRPRGAIILKSTYHGTTELDTSRIVVDEISIIGSRCGRFENALRLLESGVINIDPLITREFSLDEWELAIAEAQRPGSLKVLFRF
ncbi:MAG: alcohol dehydrogenase catalytic domain-containing protein [Acidobacteria bacterium]|nr:alcohol dehydrogenase catalytic domain-containing protein [Acidobacteriota bacterium]